jgi:hypothetical protein
VELTVGCGVGDIGELYGGSNKAEIIDGDVTLNIRGGRFTDVFGGSRGVAGRIAANIRGNVTLNLYGGTITNAFGGRSVMTTLTNDSLTLQLNEICKIELLLLTTTDVVDSSTKVIALRRTLGKEKGYQECDVEYYSVKWKRLKTNVTAL